MNEKTSNLRRFEGRTLETIEDDAHENDDDRNRVLREHPRYFDSRAYRCCFSIFHAKIGTFILVTLVFHEIVIGLLYLLSQEELKYRKVTTRFIVIFICRILQLPFTGVIYIGLWLQKRTFILPFVVSQLTIGCFADISSLVMVVKELEQSHYWLLFSGSLQWLNLIIPLLFYFSFVVCLMAVLYRCSIYFRDRGAHERRRKELTEQNTLALALEPLHEVREPAV